VETATETPTQMLSATLTETPTETLTATLTETPTEISSVEPSITPSETATSTLIATIDTTATLTTPVATEPPLTLLLNENFDNGDVSRWILGAGWTLVPNEAGNVLQLFNSPQAALLNIEDLYNLAVQLRFLLNNGTLELRVRESGAGYYAATVNAATGEVSLYRGQTLV
jgi:hypothetical protein